MGTWVRSKPLWAGIAVAVVLAVAAGTTLFNRVEYGGVNPWSAPERFEYCGAHFYRDHSTPNAGTYGDGVVVTKAQALAISGSTSLVARGGTGLFGQWQMFVPSGFQCPQDTQDEHFTWIFLSLGPDRYLDLTDAQ
ncbi:hypothetical protein KDL01_06105 [Actinospica durhamensis]|uniref:Uncharacterized protein n=1 Tax=Actinospica durhamensis TaxID=1508375 RepID=A0A941EL04_9ACTN|nr:hypothetical protein [Actinospica durhamensis]MBR7832825.1 hypothetical protein [Actinospica durhamensis]